MSDLNKKQKETACSPTACHKGGTAIFSSPPGVPKRQNSAEMAFASNLDFEETDIDDDLDPAMREELDREVEDFTRRLNSDWHERMQEIFSSGQERRFVTSLINGHASLRRCTGLEQR